MLKQRIVGFLVMASVLAIFLPYLSNQKPFPSVSPVVIPREPKMPVALKEFPQIKTEIESAFHRSLAQNTGGTPTSLQEKAWSIQLASFLDAGNAEMLVQKLRASGYAAYQQSYKGNTGPVFRVCVGPVLSLEKAKLLKEQIQKQEAFQSLDGVIMSFRPLLVGGEDGRL